jgi:hypothetical protein
MKAASAPVAIALIAVLSPFGLPGCGAKSDASGAAPSSSTGDAAPNATTEDSCGGARGLLTLATESQSVEAIAIDAKNVYWLTHTTVNPSNGPVAPPVPPPNGRVFQCAKCGCGDNPILLASGQDIWGGRIAVDATAVYWANGNVMKVPIGGGTPTTVAVAQASGPLAVDTGRATPRS